MSISNWLSFALLSVTFCLIPGPSVCFTIAYALKHGMSCALASIGGQLGANGFYILAVSVGLSRLLEGSAEVFTVLKLGGAAYLFYLGVTQWCAGSIQLAEAAPENVSAHGAWKGFVRGFVVCGTNPKTFLFYAAILPPFVSPAHDRSIQLAVLSGTIVVVGGLVLVLYALFAYRVRSWLISADRSRLRNRVAGGIMMAAAAYLALGR